MKNNNLRGLIVFILSIAFIINIGCEGPEGPIGPQGDMGSEGAQGPPGEDGQDGNANVIYSEWIAVGNLDAPSDTTVLARIYSKWDISESGLTQQIIDQGTILVYMSLSGAILPLPATFGGANPRYITFAPFQPGTLSILAQNLDNTPSGLNSSMQFRYILIPGGTASKQKLSDFSDYHETMELYGIEP